MKIQYSCGHPAISFRKTKVLSCKFVSFLFVEKLLGKCCLIDMHISKVTFYSKINTSLCCLSKSLYFPHDDSYDNRTVCLKHGVTLNFSQTYSFPWKRFLLSTQQSTPMVHMTAWKPWEESCRKKCHAKTSSLGRASLAGNKAYNHKKTITKKYWSSDTLLSRILFCSPQLWLSTTAIINSW